MYNPLLFAGLEKVTIEIAEKERYVCNVCIISNVKCITLLIPALIKPSIIWKDSNLPLSNRPSCGLDPFYAYISYLFVLLNLYLFCISHIEVWHLFVKRDLLAVHFCLLLSYVLLSMLSIMPASVSLRQMCEMEVQKKCNVDQVKRLEAEIQDLNGQFTLLRRSAYINLFMNSLWFNKTRIHSFPH